MVLLEIQFSAELEGFVSLKLVKDTAIVKGEKGKWEEERTCGYWVELAFGSGDRNDNVWIDPQETVESDKGKGEFNLVIKPYKGAKVAATVVVTGEAEGVFQDGEGPAAAATFDCRGCEIDRWVIDDRVPLIGVTPSGAEMLVVLEDGEFFDVDEESGEPVSVTNIETFVVRSKK
jgi:hypothetical protein